MRGAPVPACSLRHSRGSQLSGAGSSVWPWCRRARQRIRRNRQRPFTVAAERGSRRALGLASGGRGESCRPATARSVGALEPHSVSLVASSSVLADGRHARRGGILRPLNVHVSLVRMARPAGLKPATGCLEGSVGASRDVAWCRSTSHLPAVTVPYCRRASRSVCLRWLPDWLPKITCLR
jgi:hypothetical protein